MSPASGSRRSRSALEDDEETESLGDSTPDINSAKRARTNGYQTSKDTSNVLASDRSRRKHEDAPEDEDEDGGDPDPEAYQPGAIVRVKLVNFVTYEKAEFFPGPNLNMVIGPNGTGKSSLVCAICLGLGFSPRILGRGDSFAEFVKHGSSHAEVEIELYRKPEEPRNRVVRVRLTREGNGKDWWIDGKKTSFQAVNNLVKGCNIQIDNLCQFLPQDKVSHFSRMSAVELLLQTQRAAAPEEMIEQHEKLKKHRRDQKTLEQATEADRERLAGLESRQENLRAEVQRLEERNQVIEKIDILKRTIPFVDYSNARKQHLEFKKKKEASQKRFKELQMEVNPSLEAAEKKQVYYDKIALVVKARQKTVEQAESDAQRVAVRMESIDEQISTAVSSIEAEQSSHKARRQEINQLQRKIRELKNKFDNEKPVEFDAHEWNEKIQGKKREAREKRTELDDFKTQLDTLKQQGAENRSNQADKSQQLAALDTHEGQQMNKLEAVSKETYVAWKWIQENKAEFEKEVYGPPLITCSIKDARYTNAIESLLQNNDYLTITAQTDNDFKKLNQQLFGKMSLAFVPIKKADGAGHSAIDVPASELPRYGLDGYALDFIDGPDIVLSMLTVSKQLHKAAVALNDISEQQYNAIVASKKINNFTAGRHSYTIRRRAEYGDGAVSTATRGVQAASHWVDRPVDVSARRDLQGEIDALQAEFEPLKQQVFDIREKAKQLSAEVKSAEEEAAKLTKEKGEIQSVRSALLALPNKIKREEEELETKLAYIAEFRASVKRNMNQQDGFVLKKSEAALQYRDLVAKVRRCHQDLLEAEIRCIEAKSDVDSLEAKTEAVRQHVEQERQKVIELEAEAQVVKTRARRALEACQAIQASATEEEAKHFAAEAEKELTVEELEREILAEEAKLEYIHATNPNAIRDFERRQVEVDKMKEKIGEADERLEQLNRKITRTRSVWEPALDNLIREISDAFSYNFEQIGCAGEVSVFKSEDFNEWAIEIKVKFRENETLQILDAHRQSGGERSVSTIFYLLALQSLARAPFRVVDEINQGMDPRNERMVHERMVEIACREHTSQYFLITPKLLTGLRYDKRMKVLCIASGEHMPDDYKELDVRKIIGIKRAIMAAA